MRSAIHVYVCMPSHAMRARGCKKARMALHSTEDCALQPTSPTRPPRGWDAAERGGDPRGGRQIVRFVLICDQHIVVNNGSRILKNGLGPQGEGLVILNEYKTLTPKFLVMPHTPIASKHSILSNFQEWRVLERWGCVCVCTCQIWSFTKEPEP